MSGAARGLVFIPKTTDTLLGIFFFAVYYAIDNYRPSGRSARAAIEQQVSVHKTPHSGGWLNAVARVPGDPNGKITLEKKTTEACAR